MTDDDAFLQAMAFAPDDKPIRLAYADWLEERADPRADVLRLEWNIPRLGVFQWAQRCREAGYRARGAVSRIAQPAGQKDNSEFLEWVREHRGSIDPGWIAVVDTLGRPFHSLDSIWRPEPTPFRPGELPFGERLGLRGSVVTFETSFPGPSSWSPGLIQDLRFLWDLPPSMTWTEGTDDPIYPFVCEVEHFARPLTGRDVIAALMAKEFCSSHILTLDSTTIPWPGCHPDSDNDEVHTDREAQYLFPERYTGYGYLPSSTQYVVSTAYERFAVDAEDEVDAAHDLATHEALRAYVDGELWYVLLHTLSSEPVFHGEYHPCVILFAIGRSRFGDRLVGVVTRQWCHDLCD